MYKVMLVDDMEIVRREMRRQKVWGEASGFIISSEAGNGQQALELLSDHPVDLIITDIKMPKIDGIELLRVVVEKKLCSCVVLFSDYSEFRYARQGIILGAFDYIPKPVNDQELVHLLQRAREFLDNENMEKERVRKLESVNTDNKPNLQTLDGVKLAQLILTNHHNTISYVEQMLDQLWDSGKTELVALELAFNASRKEIISEIKQTCPTFGNFIDISEIQTFRIYPDQDYITVKTLYLDEINYLLNLSNVLKCNIQEKGIVGQVCNYVLEHVEEDISLTSVADSLFINKTYISEIFKLKTGISFSEYVTSVKIERAKLYMLKNDLKTYEVAEKLGYKDIEYFSKVFKKRTGLTPTGYRKMRLSHQ